MSRQELLSEFLTHNPGFSEEQVKVELASAGATLEQGLTCAALTWVRDEGRLSVWRATSFVDVTVISYKNHVYNGSITVPLNPGHEIKFRINNGDGNHEGFYC
jgi:hypothetical protein